MSLIIQPTTPIDPNATAAVAVTTTAENIRYFINQQQVEATINRITATINRDLSTLELIWDRINALLIENQQQRIAPLLIRFENIKQRAYYNMFIRQLLIDKFSIIFEQQTIVIDIFNQEP